GVKGSEVRILSPRRVFEGCRDQIWRMTRHEAAIREDLRIAFARMDELDDADIRLHVRDGVVTLYGDVDDHHAVSCAVRAAHDVAGVIHVRSALVVRPDVADERKPIA